MKYYAHNIGDFDKATRHLTRIERSIYRDLIELYYDTEAQLPLDKAFLCRKVMARSDEESTAVEQALNEFFTETPTGWFHERCEAELDVYRASSSQKSLAGKASAAAKALKRQEALNGKSTGVEVPLNGTSTKQEPITNKQETVVRESAVAPSTPKATRKQAIAKPESVDQQVWDDWMQLRKAKKAPVTETVLDGAVEQAGLAGLSLEAFFKVWCRRGSQGLEASWLTQTERGAAPVNKQTALEQRNRTVADEWAAGAGGSNAH